MFTGIVAEVGTVQEAVESARGRRLSISASATLEGLAIGDSVAVSGVCLTVVALGPRHFDVEAVPETLARTTLDGLSGGSQVNLERPVAASGRFDGHIVQGHVDTVAVVRACRQEGESIRVWLDVPVEHLRYVVEKGSIALDGVSLTVSAVDESGLEVVLIPHTLGVTTFASLRAGGRLNVEIDVLAKYVERLLGARR